MCRQDPLRTTSMNDCPGNGQWLRSLDEDPTAAGTSVGERGAAGTGRPRVASTNLRTGNPHFTGSKPPLSGATPARRSPTNRSRTPCRGRAGRPRFAQRIRPRLEWMEERTLLSSFTVTNTDDGGPGSLRQAILDSNAATGQANTIN